MKTIDPDNFDVSVKPGDDFFQYANGGWMKKNPIPADEARWGSFYTLRFEVEQQIKTILDEIAKEKDLPAGSAEQKVRDFYREAMDVEKRNKLGVAPLAGIFKKIDAVVKNGLFADSLEGVIGELHRSGTSAFWRLTVEQDEKQSEVMALHFYQDGLGLPDRDYYLVDDEKNRKIREDYVAYMKDLLTRSGLVENAAVVRAAEVIMAIETRLAKASLSRVELRDVDKMYNKLTLAEFAILAPKIKLDEYFKAIPSLTSAPAYLIIGQPKFFTEVNEIFENVPLEDIKLYLRWQALNGAAGYLGEDFERKAFDFYGRTFNGAKEMKPLWRRALRATDGALDELLGKLYVARYFSEDAKAKIKGLVEHLIVAYRARIEKLDWMSDDTKKKAVQKLGTVTKKLGYPDVWKDYTTLTIGTDSFVDNAMRAYAFEFDRKMREVGGPVNRDEWFMPPQLVNAYYQPPLNDIAFPAAILQPPFFDPAADDAVNFGGIGGFIGHELTHGFDDQGSRFDGQGNLKEWWTPEDKARFDAKAAQLAAQFDKHEVLPGLYVNGKLTLGENIADLGGFLIAYDGLKLALAEKEKNGTPASLIEGLTPEQRFFLSAAKSECGHYRDEIIRLQVQTDPHSPSNFRINGPLSNLSEFYEAFGVKQGDKLWRAPEDRVRIW